MAFIKASLDDRIQKMQQLRNRFIRCIGCGCLSFAECALMNPDDTLATRGPGPHLLDQSAAPGSPVQAQDRSPAGSRPVAR